MFINAAQIAFCLHTYMNFLANKGGRQIIHIFLTDMSAYPWSSPTPRLLTESINLNKDRFFYAYNLYYSNYS